jgi:hypothetical protein
METIRMATMEAGSGLRSVGVALGAALVAAAVLFVSLPAAADSPRNGRGVSVYGWHQNGRDHDRRGHHGNRYWRGGHGHGHGHKFGPNIVVIERQVVQPRYVPQPVYILPAPTIQQLYRTNSRELCREYTTTALVGGQPSEVYGIACLDANGSWQLRD